MRVLVLGATGVAGRSTLPGLVQQARSWRDYARLRGPVAGQLVDCAIQAGVPLVVHDTVTMVYQDGADQVLAEDAPVSTPGALAANLEAERQHGAAWVSTGKELT